MQRKHMEFFNLWLPLIGVGVFIAIGISAWFADYKITAVWSGFAGAVCLLLLGALQAQHSIEESRVAPPEVAIAARDTSQRAWLSIQPKLAATIRPDAAIEIELVTENVGKEPATGVSNSSLMMMFDMPEQIDYAPDLWSEGFAEVIKLQCELATPAQGRPTIFPGNKPVIPLRWEKIEDIPALIEGTKILLMWGCAGYFAGGGQTGYTTYCFYLMRDKTGKWRLGSAPIGNDTK